MLPHAKVTEWGESTGPFILGLLAVLAFENPMKNPTENPTRRVLTLKWVEEKSEAGLNFQMNCVLLPAR